MNALVRKEIRLILPGWIGAMILAIAPVWCVRAAVLSGLSVDRDNGYWLVSICLLLGLLFPALSSFGQEFTLGTFPTLLAQPTRRNQIWRLKLVALSVASALVVAASIFSFYLRFGWSPAMWTAIWRSILYAAVAISGGWWTTLLFRQTAAAFWFALLVPFLLAIVLAGGLSLVPGAVLTANSLSILLALYAVGGFTAARRMFWNAEDAPWLGRLISPLRLTSWASPKETTGTAHKVKPLRAMIRKEFELQQVTFILAAAMAVLHVVDLVVRKLCFDYLSHDAQMRSGVEVVPLLWLLAPMVAGGVMVAEERKLGTFESHLCGPVSRRWQFVVKLTVALVVGVVLGGIAPSVLESIGHAVGVLGGTDQLMVQGVLEPIGGVLIIGALAVSLVAFYASTLSRNTLQALGLTIAVSAAVAIFISGAGDPPYIGNRPIWGIPLVNYIGIPLLIAAVLALARSNYEHLHFGARIWLRNVLTLIGIVVFTLAVDACVFNRVWESWMPDEPYHPWRETFKPAPGSAKVACNDEKIAVITREGRLWLRGKPSQFLEGTDWKTAALTRSNSYALKNDGSLWDVSADPKPFLPDTRWRDIVNKNEEFIALKSDGSIWNWGNHWRGKGMVSIPPEQLSPETNWVSICASHWTGAAAKSDGSVWVWGALPTTNTAASIVSKPLQWLPPSRRKIVGLTMQWAALCVVADDGTLWRSGEQNELERLGSDSDWAEVQADYPEGLAGLKRDGSLWLIRLREGLFEQEHVSNYRVWAGISQGWWIDYDGESGYTILSFSNDGTLACYHMPYDLNWGPQWTTPGTFTAPSRLKAVKLADLGHNSN